jgi:superfamily II helicase
MAGIKNYLEGRGRMLFLVPLVALANQKYERFAERYGNDVSGEVTFKSTKMGTWGRFV